MSREMEVFDCAGVQLRRGISLVEASAGTGKTYAIAMLVLRLVAEQGISLDRLLVVTFTKAATAELRERIRKRLVEARDLLRGQAIEVDQTLRDWAAGFFEHDSALHRLEMALYDIDRAAVFTIHGFCQRMLQEQALESNQLFQVELIPDTTLVRNQIIQDFWRRSMYNLGSLPCALLLREFPTPERLNASLGRMGSDIAGIEPASLPVASVAQDLEEAYRRLQTWWTTGKTALLVRFEEAVSAGFFKNELASGFRGWWQTLAIFFEESRHAVLPELNWLSRDGLLPMLHGTKLKGDAAKEAFLRDWSLPDDLVADWQEQAAALRLALRVALAEELRTEVDRRLRGQGAMSYNDLIMGLAQALDGLGGGGLRTVLAGRYDAALIDEFQDTDAAQWQIFSTLFGSGEHSLYLIGDPKQAIYRFRGADIHTYFAARNRADRLLTLDRNFRSHPQLVAAVNRLFAGHRPFAFDDEIMPYYPVLSARTEDDGVLLQDGIPRAPMLYCHVPGPAGEKDGRWSSGKAMARVEEFVVGEILRLLAAEEPVEVGEKGILRPLRPGDIAILVRSNSQAASYQRVLLAQGIPAVLASRHSIFATAECEEMIRLLQAIQEPGNLRRQKAAMTCSWFGLNGRQLQEIWQDEEAFDRWHLRFQTSHLLWWEQGFMVMMTALLREEEVFARLAAQPLAERRIANISHLLELIQEASSTENLGPYQTLQWLQTMRTRKEVPEDYELRLESDDEAVQVVTLHSAKGLEYPLVFCPCLWYRRNQSGAETDLVLFHDEDGCLRADLGSAEFARRRLAAEEDELSEDLRLLYVAVTRAKLRCWVIWADVKKHSTVEDSFFSALGLRLFPEGQVDEEAQIARLQAMAEDQGVDWQLIEPQAAPAQPEGMTGSELQPLLCRQPSGRSLQTVWQMSSYSALASQSRQDEEGMAGDQELPAAIETSAENPILVTGLPAGAHFGNVVHDLLEKVPFAEIAAGKDLSDRFEPLKRRYGLQLDNERLHLLLQNAVSTPLRPTASAVGSFSLAMLQGGKMLKELPFYFHLGRTATDRINETLAPDPAVLPLTHREMQGYLTGFVDLVCEHDGRLYILDYKTNNLGERQADYAPERLLEAMRQHNYGLQYWLYTLVLHRHLACFLPDYDYDRHFGGILYLFIRGMRPDQPGSGVFHARPDLIRLRMLDQCLGGGQ